jgi:hypothetical protein
MTRDIIPGSRNKSYKDQVELLGVYAKKTGVVFEAPSAIGAATCILMEYISKGTKLYTDNPNTYTRCKEQVDNDQLLVGSFSADGLSIPNSHYLFNEREYYGLGSFWPISTQL